MISKRISIVLIGVAVGSAFGARRAGADRLGGGLSVTAGGGVQGFAERQMRDSTQIGGLWDVRVTYGTERHVAFEGSYVGSAQRIDALLGNSNAMLVGTTLEGAMRANALTGTWQPYAFIGAGWTHYDLSRSFTTADNGMNSTDNLFEMPMGAGLAFRHQNLIADLRGTFRYASNQDLVLTDTTTPGSAGFAPMDTWAASATFGYGF